MIKGPKDLRNFLESYVGDLRESTYRREETYKRFLEDVNHVQSFGCDEWFEDEAEAFLLGVDKGLTLARQEKELQIIKTLLSILEETSEQVMCNED